MGLEGQPSLKLPGIFRFGLAPAGVGRPPEGRPACRLQGRIGARGASPQGSILRCSNKKFRRAVPPVNYFIEVSFILARRLVAQAAVQPLVVIVDFDVLKELPARLGLSRKDLIGRKGLGFQRAPRTLQ